MFGRSSKTLASQRAQYYFRVIGFVSKWIKSNLDPVNAVKSSQLIITTHETNLLDLEILRRDEIWFAEKRENGSTDLYSLSDFQPRYDKDIRRDYLVGRYGGIPFIGNVNQLRLPPVYQTVELEERGEGDAA